MAIINITPSLTSGFIWVVNSVNINNLNIKTF
jgi:hypothetical protein